MRPTDVLTDPAGYHLGTYQLFYDITLISTSNRRSRADTRGRADRGFHDDGLTNEVREHPAQPRPGLHVRPGLLLIEPEGEYRATMRPIRLRLFEAAKGRLESGMPRRLYAWAASKPTKAGGDSDAFVLARQRRVSIPESPRAVPSIARFRAYAAAPARIPPKQELRTTNTRITLHPRGLPPSAGSCARHHLGKKVDRQSVPIVLLKTPHGRCLTAKGGILPIPEAERQKSSR